MKSLEIPLIPKYCLQSFAFYELLRKRIVISAMFASLPDNFVYFFLLLFHVRLVNLNNAQGRHFRALVVIANCRYKKWLVRILSLVFPDVFNK